MTPKKLTTGITIDDDAVLDIDFPIRMYKNHLIQKEMNRAMREKTKRSVNQYSALREKPSRLLTLVHHWREKNTLVQEG